MKFIKIHLNLAKPIMVKRFVNGETPGYSSEKWDIQYYSFHINEWN